MENEGKKNKESYKYKNVHEIIGHQLFVSAHVRTSVVSAIANPPSASVQTVIVVVRGSQRINLVTVYRRGVKMTCCFSHSLQSLSNECFSDLLFQL